MRMLENRTINEIRVGDTCSIQRTITKNDVMLFAKLSGDMNPIHVDESFARENMYGKIVAQGIWVNAIVSTLIGTKLPGPGTVFLNQNLTYRRPIGLDDTVTANVIVRARHGIGRQLTLDVRVVNQKGENVADGSVDVLTPRRKIRRAAATLPDLAVEDADWAPPIASPPVEARETNDSRAFKKRVKEPRQA